MPDSKVREFLNRKVKSRRDRYNNYSNDSELLPTVGGTQIESGLKSEISINLPSHYCYFHNMTPKHAECFSSFKTTSGRINVEMPKIASESNITISSLRAESIKRILKAKPK